MEHGLNPAFHPPDRPDKGGPLRDDAPQAQRSLIRRPDFRKKACGMKVREDLLVYLVNLHARMGDGGY